MNNKSIHIICFSILMFIINLINAKVPELNAILKENAFHVQVNYSDEVLIIQKGRVKKFDSQGKFLALYGSIYINEQTKIISQNTFRTVLFCEDFGKIIVLDKRFGVIEIIDTYNIENYLITTIGISYDNENLWIWDEIKQALIKINQQGKSIYTTSNLNIYTNTSIVPYAISEISTKLYVNDTSKGIYIFDNTGTYKNHLPIPNINSFSLKEDLLLYTTTNNKIFAYNMMSFETINFIDVPNLKDIKIGQNIICGIDANGFIEIWNY